MHGMGVTHGGTTWDAHAGGKMCASVYLRRQQGTDALHQVARVQDDCTCSPLSSNTPSMDLQVTKQGYDRQRTAALTQLPHPVKTTAQQESDRPVDATSLPTWQHEGQPVPPSREPTATKGNTSRHTLGTSTAPSTPAAPVHRCMFTSVYTRVPLTPSFTRTVEQVPAS
jgi:hypothetical protein